MATPTTATETERQMYRFILALVAVICYLQALITLPVWAGVTILLLSSIAAHGYFKRGTK